MSENKKPRLAEILGVKVGQEFRVDCKECEANRYAVNNHGFVRWQPIKDNPLLDGWHYLVGTNNTLYKIINNPSLIRPVMQWTQDDIEDANAVRRLYPECEWVARDNGIWMYDTSLFAYDGKPTRESDRFSVGVYGKAYGYLPLPLTALPSVTWENSPVRIADILGDVE